MKAHYWVISAISAVVLSACGGGGSNSSDTAPASVPPASSLPLAGTPSGAIAGVVVASDTGLPLAGVQVQVAGSTGSTAADGSFSQSGLGSTERQVVRFVRDGYADTFATTAVTSDATASVTGRMVPIAARTTFDNSAGTTLTDSNSAASVIIPPAAVVDAATGVVPQGAITLQIAVINPATNPANMPGNYTASTGSTIESFGALSVQLRDAAGKRLNLATGKSATIRIPLMSRSDQPQQTIPLFYFNETTGLWVEEGTATLAGVAPNQYYEGIVTHFSTWNADKVVDTIFVNGCLSGAVNQPLGGITVRSSGIDYSGVAVVRTDTQGKFRVAIRRNGLASIAAAYPRSSTAATAGPSANDLTLPACLMLSPAGEKSPPVFLVPVVSMVAPSGSPVTFAAVMASDDRLTYQWSRNGRAIDGATQSIYRLPSVTPADNQAQLTVKVTNEFGSVTSEPATLTVIAAANLADLNDLLKMVLGAFDMYSVTGAPLDLFEKNGTWLAPASVCSSGNASGSLDGQPIPAGTEVADFNYVINGTFDKCITRDDPAVELSGFASASFTANADVSLLGVTWHADNFRRISRQGNVLVTDITGNGTEKSRSTISSTNGLETSGNVSAPVPGATLLNNLTGEVTQFVSGDTVSITTEIMAKKMVMASIEQRSRTFTIAGVRYVANGLLSLPVVIDTKMSRPEQLKMLQSVPSASGQISLTRNGFQLGRIFATPEGLLIEINGVVKPMFSKVP